MNEKIQMMQKLRQHGIQTILTRPEDLNINTLNKYLELKSRGLI
jgi:N-acetylmuramoyl-L-alanine amidase